MAVMNKMRENMKTILMILVLAFMLTIIIDWGMGGLQGGRKRGVIANVNGHDISYEQFYEQYQRELSAYRDRTGEEPEGQQLQQVENQVFESLVQQVLLSDIIEKMDLQATNAEIVETIFNYPPDFLKTQEAFLDSNGVFSMERYKQALNNQAANWTPVENYVRLTLPYNKLDALLQSSAFVSEEDARLQYMKNNLKAKIDYIFYNASVFADEVSEPTDKEISTYYEEHKEDYEQPERRVLDYVLLDTSPTASDSQKILNQAQDLLEEARSEGDFEELAQIYSQDTGTAEKGGDLGYFGRGSMVKPFEEAAFNTEPGKIVGPIESTFGLHIIKVEDKKTVDGEMQVKARHILLKYEASPSTLESLREEAEYISEYAKESNLQTVAESENLTVQTSQPFASESFIPGIGMEPSINRFAFRNKVGTVSDVYNTQKGFLVVSVAQVLDEGYRPLDQVKNQIISNIKLEKQKEKAKDMAEKAFQKIQSGKPIDQVAEMDSLKVNSTEEFTMSGYIPGIGSEPKVAGTAFSLEEGDISKPIQASRGYYIIQLLEKKGFNEEDFQNKKQSLMQQALMQKRNRVYAQWYSQIKEKADIKDYRGDFL